MPVPSGQHIPINVAERIRKKYRMEEEGKKGAKKMRRKESIPQGRGSSTFKVLF